MKRIITFIMGAIIGISIATKQPILKSASDVFGAISKTYVSLSDTYNKTKLETKHTSKTISGRVIKVYDGDTITVLNGEDKLKIRLYGVDAPELKQTFGKTSQMHLEKLIKNEIVEIEVINKDRYGRTVAKVYLEDGTLINKWLVEQGLVFVYEEYNDEKDEYLKLQNEAKKQKLGLWKLNNVEKPSEYRKKNK